MVSIMFCGPLLNFYPRPPRGGRRAAAVTALQYEEFLSTPSARRATRRGVRRPVVAKFLSTPSARRATVLRIRSFERQNISIHALREEGDVVRGENKLYTSHFYPRPPRGGRPLASETRRPVYSFLSTPSARRATAVAQTDKPQHKRISIHALREEGD